MDNLPRGNDTWLRTSESGGVHTQHVIVSQSDGVLLANNDIISATMPSVPVGNIPARTYVWDAQWTGGGTLELRALGSDSKTWRTVAILAAPGIYAGEIRIGNNAVLQLYNPNNFSITSVYSSVS